MVLGEFEQYGDQVPRVLTAEEGFEVCGGCLSHESGQGFAVQLDGVPWIESQKLPCQFQKITLSSVQATESRDASMAASAS